MNRAMKLLLTAATTLVLPGCSGLERAPKIDDGIVTPDVVGVQKSVAELALEVAQVKRGDEVEILERRGEEWIKIRTASGIEGWIESHTVAKKSLIEEANRLAEQVKSFPTQAVGELSGPTRLRVTPGRATDENAVMTLSRQTVVEVLDRQRTFREQDTIVQKNYQPNPPRSRSPASATDEGEPQGYDDWYQVRLPQDSLARAGWVYAPLVDLQVPTRLVQLQEDHNIIGWFEVGQLEDSEIGPVTHYLSLGRKRYGFAHGTDFNRLELFWWSPTQHRYYRSARTIHGMLPVTPEDQDGAWVFRMQAYNPASKRLEEMRFLVDVREPFSPKFVPIRK